jgi:hypothetical protein
MPGSFSRAGFSVSLHRTIHCGIAVVACIFFSACNSQNPRPPEPTAAPFVPQNFARYERMPSDLHRAAVLPLWHSAGSDEAFIGDIEAALLLEVNASGAFETVFVTRPQMRELFGRRQFTSTELLPSNLLPMLQSRFRADAVLLLDLTVFDPYRPLRMGLRGKLLDIRSGQMIWAFDEIFNAGDPSVAAGALAYNRAQNLSSHPLDRSGSVLQSPRLFAKYAAYMAFQTLPPRFVEE